MILAAACATLLAACGADGTSTSTPAGPAGLTFVVRVTDNAFTPQHLTVPTGTSVTWEWSGKNEHSVVGAFGAGDVQSPRHRGSGQFALTMGVSGTYFYHCGVHGNAMSGTVTVN